MCDKPLAGNEALLYGKFKKGLEDIIISSVCGVLFVMVSCYDMIKWCLTELGILLGGVETYCVDDNLRVSIPTGSHLAFRFWRSFLFLHL